MTNPMLEMSPIDVKLTAPPLERVLAAVAFSPVLKINDPTGAGVAPFQDLVRSLYPEVVLEHDHGIQLETDAEGKMVPPALVETPVWRFFSANKDWRVSLTSQSISLETITGYQGRSDLLERFLFICQAVSEAYQPQALKRVGFRYFNVFGKDKLSRISEFVRPQVLGFCTAQFEGELTYSTAQEVFQVPEGILVMRHGILGVGMVHEFREQPAHEKKWVLDLDAWTEQDSTFERDHLLKEALALTDRLCKTFRWVVTPEFMEAYS